MLTPVEILHLVEIQIKILNPLNDISNRTHASMSRQNKTKILKKAMKAIGYVAEIFRLYLPAVSKDTAKNVTNVHSYFLETIHTLCDSLVRNDEAIDQSISGVFVPEDHTESKGYNMMQLHCSEQVEAEH